MTEIQSHWKLAFLGPQCQPFDMLKPENYESWKQIEVTLEPKDMYRAN
jgi:hypothetical protein